MRDHLDKVMISIAFFSSKSRVGQTSLVYHLAWMFAELGLNVLAADLDPQADLTSMFLNDEELEELWPVNETNLTAIDLFRRTDPSNLPPRKLHNQIYVVPGVLEISKFEGTLAEAWIRCQDGDTASLLAVTAPHRALNAAAEPIEAHVTLIDLGANLGAVNRTALLASDYVIVPLISDLYSVQALQSVGPQLRDWRSFWQSVKREIRNPEISLPRGAMTPVGYAVLQHQTTARRPRGDYLRWMEQVPANYRRSVLFESEVTNVPTADDPNFLGMIRRYVSLMPMALEASKPIFFLKPADGAVGAHAEAVRDCYKDWQNLAKRIAERCSVPIPMRDLSTF